MATRPYPSRCTFNTTQTAFSSSNMNFYYVFHLIHILDFFSLLLVKVELVGEYCCHCLSFSLSVDPPFILSTDHTMYILSLVSLSPKFSLFNLELLFPTAFNQKSKTAGLFSKVPSMYRFFFYEFPCCRLVRNRIWPV